MPEQNLRVLVVDDEEAHAETVAETLERAGYETTIAASGRQGLQKLRHGDFDLVLTDLVMGDVDGLEILREAKAVQPDAEVVVITGHGSIESAVQAMQHGAATYLAKPFKIEELRAVVAKAAERVHLVRSNQDLRRQLDERFGFEGIIGQSAAMQRVLRVMKQVAPTPASVLILGETGTGKDLVAQALHNNSRRKGKPFVPINCGALPEGTLESELFGHEKGAFTGADRVRQGRFEFADGGTVFLDEVGEMPLATQVKLLRVLENQEVVRVGSNEPRKVDVRLIAATNKNLEQEVAENRFREDLYYRLKTISIQLPPLRERREDIPLLIDHLLRQLAPEYEREVPRLTQPFVRAMQAYDWPGNIRELRQELASALIMDIDDRLDIDDLPDKLRTEDTYTPVITGVDHLAGQPLAAVERYYIEKALELAAGNRKKAADALGIGERTLYRKLDEYAKSTGNKDDAAAE